MRVLTIEHKGTKDSVKSKLARVKKTWPLNFVSRKWRIYYDNSKLGFTNLKEYSFDTEAILTSEQIK
jgi:hypothetical protein